MSKLLMKVIIQERLADNSIQSIQSLVFTESLDPEYASKLTMFHIIQAHSRTPLIDSINQIQFDADDPAQFTVNSNFIVRVDSMIQVTDEQIQFLGAIDILGYNLGTSRLKSYLPDTQNTVLKPPSIAVVA